MSTIARGSQPIIRTRFATRGGESVSSTGSSSSEQLARTHDVPPFSRRKQRSDEGQVTQRFVCGQSRQALLVQRHARWAASALTHVHEGCERTQRVPIALKHAALHPIVVDALLDDQRLTTRRWWAAV
jgi:hypothetical protein